MGKFLDCPFCGTRGARSAEHVWGQWLHALPAAKWLTGEYTGQQLALEHDILGQDAEGRFTIQAKRVGSWSPVLPKVKIAVCEKCNNGWMSSLENDVKTALGPYLFQRRTIRLTVADLERIATWAMKTWMVYALTLPKLEDPFSEEDYRRMATSQALPSNSRTWMMTSEASPFTQVGIGVRPFLLSSPGVPDFLTTRSNAAFAYLAAGGVFFFMVLMPDFVQHVAGVEVSHLTDPPVLSYPHVRAIWPNPRPQYLPLADVTASDVAVLLEWPEKFLEQVALPLEGLTPDEVDGAYADYLEGTDPSDLRRRITGAGS